MKKYVIVVLFGSLLVAIVLRTSFGRLALAQLKGIIGVSTNYINEEGNTIASRVVVPEGFTRVRYPSDSFQEYVRTYPLKEPGTPIINYDKTKYAAQYWHDAILDISVPKNGLQQCADALIRIRSEYLWEQDRKEEIGFNFTSGHYCSWEKYAQGYRPKINGNNVTFHKTESPDYTSQSFYSYLNLIFTYSGTLSLYTELSGISVENVTIGDMLINPGTPGHVEMIADEITDEAGNKMFLLIQGNTPAQSVCLLKNFEDHSSSPWYHFEKGEPIYTPGYHFEEPIFIRFKGL